MYYSNLCNTNVLGTYWMKSLLHTDLKYIKNCTVHTLQCQVCTVPFNRVLAFVYCTWARVALMYQLLQFRFLCPMIVHKDRGWKDTRPPPLLVPRLLFTLILRNTVGLGLILNLFTCPGAEYEVRYRWGEQPWLQGEHILSSNLLKRKRIFKCRPIYIYIYIYIQRQQHYHTWSTFLFSVILLF